MAKLERPPANEDLFWITHEYVAGRERGDSAILATLIERYPAYAAQILDFATTYYSMEEAPPMLMREGHFLAHDPSAERRVLEDTLDQLRGTSFQSIVRTMENQGLPLNMMAQKIGLGEDVLAKLDGGRIAVESVPEQLLSMLGSFLHMPARQLRSILAHRQAAGGDGGQGRETFAEAVRTSRIMTARDRSRWLYEPADSHEMAEK